MREGAKRVIPFHEAANIFPLMEGEEFQALVNDIRKNGQQEPIWTYQGKILDGRNRYSAILRLQEQGSPIVPKFREWSGKGNVTAFVVSLNLHRRHLDESQRALIAAKLSNQKRGGDRKSEKINAPNGAKVSQPQAAEMLNTTRRTVQRAAKVLQHGDENLTAAVQSGEMSVAAASQTVDAVNRYPEVAAIKGARPQDKLTIANNLDRLPEAERKKKLKLLAKGDEATETELANKPPMPPAKPASSFDRWDGHLDKVERTFIDLERVVEQLMSEWDTDEKQRFLNKLGDIEAQLTNIQSTTLRSVSDDGTTEGRESATTIH